MEKVRHYLTWPTVAIAACTLLLSLISYAFSERGKRLDKIEDQLKTKVEVTQYREDVNRMEKKLDILINMHMSNKYNK